MRRIETKTYLPIQCPHPYIVKFASIVQETLNLGRKLKIIRNFKKCIYHYPIPSYLCCCQPFFQKKREKGFFILSALKVFTYLVPSDINKFFKLYLSCLVRFFDQNTFILSKNVHDQVSVFNQILMNVFTNYLPNIYMTFDDRGYSLDQLLDRKLNLAK